jgi:hypothetical protein
MTLRTRISALAAALAITFVAACSEDDPVAPIPAGAADITLDITTSRTLYAETTYTLKGFIHVKNGATLTINAGTHILGDYATLGSSLFILRGAKIQAVGTATNPIVFTSSQPVGQRSPGDWGGLIIVGNGMINRTGNIAVEGTGTCTNGGVCGSGKNDTVYYSQTGGVKGTGDNTDSSGELKYVRVEFAGYAPAPGVELNSYTFAAVGSGTKLSYLQSMAGLDDSYEFFGGAVDADHIVSYESGDDHFDMSESYSGRISYAIAFQSTVLTPRSGAGSAASDPEGVENDGCNGTGCDNGFNQTPYTIPLLSNFTLVGTGSKSSSGSSVTDGGIGMMLRRGTGGYYVNGIIARYPLASMSVRSTETYARAGSVTTPDVATADFAVKNLLVVECPAVFQAATGSGEGNVQASFDLAGNSITNSAATTASLFAKFPATVSATTVASDFDWSPSATSAALTGGMTTFTGKIATKVTTATATGLTITGSSFVGAAGAATAKWWDGWTVYFRT